MKETLSLNPEVETLMVGKRALRPVEILPLSMADMKRFGTALDATVRTFLGMHTDVEGVTVADTVPFVKALIAGELGRMLALATGEEDAGVLAGTTENPLLEEMTVAQTLEAAEIVFRQNFSVTGKKFETLVPGLQKLLMSLSKRP